MANLNIGASLGTVTSLASLPVDKGTVYATLSTSTSVGVASAMYPGQIMDVVINPTANITLPIPTTGGWQSTFGQTLNLKSGAKMVLTISCIGSGQYLVSCNNQ